MAITSFGTSTSTPADNGSQAGPTVAVAPVASMVEGDLVLLTCVYKATGITMAMSQTSGQTWTALAQCEASGLTIRTFWARFNGTWGANPSVTITSGTLAMTVVMHVYRPTVGTNSWAVDVAQVELDFAAPGSPFTVTITGQTTQHDSTVTYAVWSTSDDNSWTSIAGTGWVVKGAAQYRNLQGNDTSAAFAHKIQSAAGATGNVSLNQSVVTGDAGTTSIVTFYEFAGAAEVLASVVAGISTASGALSVAKKLAATSAGVSTVTAAASVAKRLAATSGAVSNVSGSLAVERALAGSCLAESAVTANLAGGSEGSSDYAIAGFGSWGYTGSCGSNGWT